MCWAFQAGTKCHMYHNQTISSVPSSLFPQENVHNVQICMHRYTPDVKGLDLHDNSSTPKVRTSGIGPIKAAT